MKYLLYWLPAVAAVVVAALVIHSPVVDAWHDWTRGWQPYLKWDLLIVAGLGAGAWCFLMLLCSWLVYELPANRRQRRQP